ncbi:MAG: NGG1p interacting factor NIF3 [Pseudomonadales bacterium]
MQYYKLIFYVPSSHLEEVKSALFATGVGRDRHYERCAWQTLGTAQFVPLDSANPFIGQANQCQALNEYRVEMLCAEHCLEAAISALKLSHPYEYPAFEVYSPLLTGAVEGSDSAAAERSAK